MGEQMKNADDSLKYLGVLAKLYETEPTNTKIFFLVNEVLSAFYSPI